MNAFVFPFIWSCIFPHRGGKTRHTQTLKVFLKWGQVDPEIKSEKGETLLDLAIKTGNHGTVLLLDKTIKKKHAREQKLLESAANANINAATMSSDEL
jgi:hypothetical protein